MGDIIGIKIDEEELRKQRIEEIKKGNFIEVELLIDVDKKEPPHSFIKSKGSTFTDIAFTLHCLELMKKDLIKLFPEVKEIYEDNFPEDIE